MCGGEVLQIGEALTAIILLNEVRCILPHNGPVVPLPKGFLDESSCSEVVLTYPFKDLLKYIVDFIWSYTLEKEK